MLSADEYSDQVKDAIKEIVAATGAVEGHVWELIAQFGRENAAHIRAWAETQMSNAYDMADAYAAADLIDPDQHADAHQADVAPANR